MDGLFHGKPYEQMDDMGLKKTIGSTPLNMRSKKSSSPSKKP